MADYRNQAGELAQKLSNSTEAVCRHYLSAGRRSGRYWTVGDVHNTPGQSLYVRLTGPSSGRGAVGRWCDAAAGQHGDLLDLIRLRCGFGTLRDAMVESRAFLALAPPAPQNRGERALPSSDMVAAARKLFACGRPIRGTLAERYLRARGIDLASVDGTTLRFHPAAWYRETPDSPRQTWPALLASVTDTAGAVTGVHRTFLDPTLDPARLGKAPVTSPRRSLGSIAGNGVRLRSGNGLVLLVGEGLETSLSLAPLFPEFGVIAALSAAHLAMLILPSDLTELLIARDNDAAGRNAAERLRERAEAVGVSATVLRPRLIDFNADLRRWGASAIAERVGSQLPGNGRRRDAA